MNKLKTELNLCKKKLFANRLKKGESWNGFEVYEPVYKKEFIGGLPRVILVKNDVVRISSYEECFEYLRFINQDKGKSYVHTAI